MSTAARPKPFISLLGERSLFQATVERVMSLAGAREPLIITGAAHVADVRDQLSAMGVEAVIVAEPEGRDSGPALIAAALMVSKADPKAIALAVAADHHIPDRQAFAASVAVATPAAEAGAIVTFGVRPSFPATAYGYIRPGEPLQAGVHRVAAFVEKPAAGPAAELLASGALWNSGNFLFRVDTMLAEAGVHAPALLASAERAVAGGVAEGGVFTLGADFGAAPRIAIDVAVMEKTARAAVLPIAYDWSDVGAWSAVWDLSRRDGAGNSVVGEAVIDDSEGCLIRAGPDMEVIALGLKHLTVIAEDGKVLVSDMARATDLKGALESLRQKAVAGRRDRRGGDVAGRLSRWLRLDALPLWWCFGADHVGGGFHEALSADLTPTDAPRRTRVQARQVYVYATAGLTGWPGPWRDAVDHGLTELFTRRQGSNGLFLGLTDRSGAPMGGVGSLYDQAFVLLALATAAHAWPDRARDLGDRGLALGAAIRRTFVHEGGGFRATAEEAVFAADPVMHLFEAALAWLEVDDGPFWNALADELAALFLERMYEPNGGRIREVFDPHWRPAPGLEGRILRPGHHFEWAWLIERWARRRRDDAHRVARDLYASGERGVDPATGLVLDTLLDDFTPQQTSSRLWPQTERVKAALLLAPADDKAAAPFVASAVEAARAMESYIDPRTPGLWADAPLVPGVSNPAPALASSFYHIAGAIRALEGAQTQLDKFKEGRD